MPRSPDLSPAELRVMKALWAIDRGSVSEVRAELARRGQDLAYTTVMTLLGRLATKGAVEVDKEREPFLYRAAHRRESVLRDRLRAFVAEVFDGEAQSLVLNLVEDSSLSRAELRAIERKISEAEKLEERGARAPKGQERGVVEGQGARATKQGEERGGRGGVVEGQGGAESARATKEGHRK